MDIEVFPEIAPQDYASFRAILGDDIPDAYDEWLKLQTKEIREFVQAGRAIRRVQVHSHEFARLGQTQIL